MIEVLKPSEVLDRAADLIEPEGKWTQNALARDRPQGRDEWVFRLATCFCAAGAILRASGAEQFAGWDLGSTAMTKRCAGFVARDLSVLRDDAIAAVETWNDAPGRTQPEVVAALRKAADLARSEGQ